jgi:hypothetical protein
MLVVAAIVAIALVVTDLRDLGSRPSRSASKA